MIAAYPVYIYTYDYACIYKFLCIYTYIIIYIYIYIIFIQLHIYVVSSFNYRFYSITLGNDYLSLSWLTVNPSPVAEYISEIPICFDRYPRHLWHVDSFVKVLKQIVNKAGEIGTYPDSRSSSSGWNLPLFIH